MTDAATIGRLPERLADGTPDQEDRIAALLVTIGRHVREGRQRLGLSRRELSEAARVSQRYIAQLEGGQGNVSIALLARLADALRVPLVGLLADEHATATDVGAIERLLPAASDEQLARIRAILDPSHETDQRARRIAFIGLRGAGKSTLGKASADRLGLPFLELNAEIEQASGMAVDEVIALYGQEGYRHLEGLALERAVTTHNAVVLAVAGGIVSNADSFEYLLANFQTIWLKAAPEEHMARVRGQGDERPMAGNPDAMNQLRQILTDREALYAQATLTIDTSGQTLEESLESVLDAIARESWLG